MLKALFTGRGLLMTLVILVGVAILCRLGIWQLDRLAQRQAINSSINTRMAQPALPLTSVPADPAAIEYRHVELRGTYDPAQEIILRNRELDGYAGVHVLTPLRLANGTAVLVDRGWLPRDHSTPDARGAYAAPTGEVAIQGIVRLSQEDAGGPKESPLGPGEQRRDAWFRVDIPAIQQQAGYALLPVFIEQQPAPDDPELPRRVATTDLGQGPHMGYAVQWFAFAVILAVGYVVVVRQRLRSNM